MKKILLLFLLSPMITFADTYLSCEGDMNVTFVQSEKYHSYKQKISIERRSDTMVIKGIEYLKDAFDSYAYFSETSLEITFFAKIPFESTVNYISGTLDRVTGKFTHKSTTRSDGKLNQKWDFFGDCKKTEPMI